MYAHCFSEITGSYLQPGVYILPTAITLSGCSCNARLVQNGRSDRPTEKGVEHPLEVRALQLTFFFFFFFRQKIWRALSCKKFPEVTRNQGLLRGEPKISNCKLIKTHHCHGKSLVDIGSLKKNR